MWVVCNCQLPSNSVCALGETDRYHPLKIAGCRPPPQSCHRQGTKEEEKSHIFREVKSWDLPPSSLPTAAVKAVL